MSEDTGAIFEQRRNRLLGRMEELDGLLLTAPVNVRYLSGFSGEDSWLLLTPDECTLITDGRFVEQASRECPDIDIAVREAGMVTEAGEVITDAGLGRCGFEAETMNVATAEDLRREVVGCELEPTRGLVGRLRQVKDEAEIGLIRRAVAVAQAGWKRTVREGLRTRRTERETAGFLDWSMRRAGADEAAFETICAFNENASMPHARPTDKTLAKRAVVLFDWGARRDGYNSDLTRVVALDRMPAQLAEIYEIVLAAQKAAIDRVAPGVTCRDVDAAAREVISSHGYGEAFGHGTGHGVGLEIHEPPSLNTRNEQELEAGMVVTIEPGIYVPEVGGVRIEDLVLVTEEAHEVLTDLPKDLDVVQQVREKPLWT